MTRAMTYRKVALLVPGQKCNPSFNHVVTVREVIVSPDSVRLETTCECAIPDEDVCGPFYFEVNARCLAEVPVKPPRTPRMSRRRTELVSLATWVAEEVTGRRCAPTDAESLVDQWREAIRRGRKT